MLHMFFLSFPVKRRRKFPVHLKVVLIQRLSNHQIKFYSWRICRRRPTKWCYQCCSTNFQVSKKYVWFRIVMTLHSLNLQQSCRVVLPKRHFRDSKLHQHTQWKLHLQRNRMERSVQHSISIYHHYKILIAFFLIVLKIKIEYFMNKPWQKHCTSLDMV